MYKYAKLAYKNVVTIGRRHSSRGFFNIKPHRPISRIKRKTISVAVSSLNEQSSLFREMVQQEAVVVRNAVKRYDSEKVVLDGLNMTVSRGSM